MPTTIGLPNVKSPARLQANLFACTAALGALLLLISWWNHSPIEGPGAIATSLGRLVGLFAGYLLLIQLLIRARVPWLERAFTTRQIARWHATCGVIIVVSLWGHAALITLGYARASHSSWGHQIISMVGGFPHLAAATGALLAFSIVGVTAVPPVRARLTYEIWHVLHLAVYLGLYLALAHQISLGEDFRHSPMARTAWTTAFIAVAALAAANRVVRPLVLYQRHRFVVERIEPLTSDAFNVYIGGLAMAKVAAHAGQFVRIRVLQRGLWWAANPYSLSTSPDGGHLRFTVKGVGDHSRALRQVSPGTPVLLEGPSGGLRIARSDREIVFIAGGIGITPIRAILESPQVADRSVTLLYRVSRTADRVLGEELEQLCGALHARLVYVVGTRTELGCDPLDAATLTRLAPHIAQSDVFVCGPPGMTNQLCRTLTDLHVPPRRIYLEAFTV